jgi:hypothetical protein
MRFLLFLLLAAAYAATPRVGAVRSMMPYAQELLRQKKKLLAQKKKSFFRPK